MDVFGISLVYESQILCQHLLLLSLMILLSFIANIFFLILLIEQLNFLYKICLIKLLIFCFILEFLIHGGGRKIRTMVLQVIMIYHFMVDTVYVCILTERVYYIVLYYVRHCLTKQKRIH